MATFADVCPHHETERGAAAKVLGRTGSEGVREGFVNKVGSAVCWPCFDNPVRIIADLGPTFRDLSIGTLASCASFDRLAAA